MKTSLAHLPERKQQVIADIVKVILERMQPEKVILFGSHATGKWVEDRYVENGITYEYISDYDILIVSSADEPRTEADISSFVDNRFSLDTYINIIMHDIDYVNRKLSDGHYFFSDIKKEGIMLYDADNIALVGPREKSEEEIKALAQQNYDYWSGSSKGFLNSAIRNKEVGEYKIAAFELHQATERIYNCVELVFTEYRPKLHNIKKLYGRVKRFSKELAMVFPQNTEQEAHLFDLLKRGYVEARYDPDYTITAAELTELIHRVRQLQDIAAVICKERIGG